MKGTTAIYILLLITCMQVFRANARQYWHNRMLDNDSMVTVVTYCKQQVVLHIPKERTAEIIEAVHAIKKEAAVQGNLRYDFLYRSLTDTPFAQQDFMQHTLQASARLLVKGEYPLLLNIMVRKSNSPYFRDRVDAGLQFSGNTFLSRMKQKLQQLSAADLHQRMEQEMAGWKQQQARLQQEIARLRNQVENPAVLPALITEREEGIRRKAGTDSLLLFFENNKNKIPVKGWGKAAAGYMNAKAASLPDSSAAGKLAKQWAQAKQALARYQQELAASEQKIKAIKKAAADTLSKWKQEISRIRNPDELKRYAAAHNEKAARLPRGWKALTALQQFSAGRTWLDVSELTVKNISLTGVQAAFYPSRFYVAAGGGRINARYRDFIMKQGQAPAQSLFFLRAGIGRLHSNYFILTYYEGKKELLRAFGPGQSFLPAQTVAGISAEGKLAINEHISVSAEIARSSYFSPDATVANHSAPGKQLWNLRSRTNEAYSIKAAAYWPQTATRFTGFFRKMNRQFQSFHLLPAGNMQEAYQLQVRQSFWKQRVQLEAGVKKNDFSNAFITPGISSRSVFKTAVLSVRIPRYPSVTLSWYPSSQVTVLDDNVLAENQYNTLSGTVHYLYRTGELSMSTTAVYLRFFNESADSGFIYYNSSNLTLQHLISARRFQWQSGFTWSVQPGLRMLTLEQSGHWQAGRWLGFSAGIRYSRIPAAAHTYWGGMAGMQVEVRRWGTLQLFYDKSYLPGTARNLLPVDMGRISYQRNF